MQTLIATKLAGVDSKQPPVVDWFSSVFLKKSVIFLNSTLLFWRGLDFKQTNTNFLSNWLPKFKSLTLRNVHSNYDIYFGTVTFDWFHKSSSHYYYIMINWNTCWSICLIVYVHTWKTNRPKFLFIINTQGWNPSWQVDARRVVARCSNAANRLVIVQNNHSIVIKWTTSSVQK